MFGKLKKKLDQLLTSLENKAGANPGEDITRLLAGMREELIEAKATIPELEKHIESYGKLRQRELQRAQLQPFLRRRGQAEHAHH